VTRKSYLTAAVGLWILGSLLAGIPVIFRGRRAGAGTPDNPGAPTSSR
jgi:hypothetical protein